MSLDVREFIGQLRKMDAQLWLENGSLRCSAPPHTLTEELRQELRARKEEIVDFLQAARESTRQSTPEVPVARPEILPLSYAQERLWLLHQIDPSAVYNIPLILRLSGALDEMAVEKALGAIVARHEVLRSTFPARDGMPYQRIGRADALQIERIDLRDLPPEEREARAFELLRTELADPIDPLEGPLLRCRFMALAKGQCLLQITTHHMVFDGWSASLLCQELTDLYRDFTLGRDPTLEPLQLQYVDYVLWHRPWVESQLVERQMAFWKERLRGLPVVAGLPLDRPRPKFQTFRGERQIRVLSPALCRELFELSCRFEVTMFMTLLSAFYALWWRYTGETDLVVGTPVANRRNSVAEKLIGPFLNTLVLRCDLSGDPSFVDLLSRVNEVTLSAYANQDVPFERLVDELKPPRSQSFSPLFQVLVAMHNFPSARVEFPQVEVRGVDVDAGGSKFDLSVYFFDIGRGLWVEGLPGEIHKESRGLAVLVEYNLDLFNRETMGRWLDHFENLVSSLPENPGCRLSRLPILSPEERHRMLVGGNETAREYPRVCVHELFQAQAARTPDRRALADEAGSLTYRELNRRADHLARQIQGLGVAPGSRVAVVLPRTRELGVALLAVWKAGGAYVPLSPEMPERRLRDILEDCRPQLTLISPGARLSLPGVTLEVELTDPGEVELTPSRGDPASMAYLIYTSGSTGKPKGVKVSHLNLVNFLNSMARAPGIQGHDVLLSVTTPAFDIFGLELYLPLLHGACCVLAGTDTTSEASRLMTLMEREHPTMMQATPATWKMLIDGGWKGRTEMVALCGGEAFSSEMAEGLLERCRSVWNMYGPTETTIWSAVGPLAKGRKPALGPPLDNTQLVVLDAEGQPVPVGVEGELYIGGDGVALGYWEREELTAEKFVANPFPELATDRLYRTGDRVRRLPGGEIVFLGRYDHQLKIRGFRVEGGEVESCLRSHRGVRDCAVSVREFGPDDRRLVAHVVPAEGPVPTHQELGEHLRALLPHYMVPSAFEVLEQLPRTHSGKLNRGALAEAPAARLPSSTPFEAAQTETERIIASIWREVLQVNRVGLHDNFFDLGGQSLLLVRVHSRLQEAFERRIPVVQLFEHPTVARLATFLEGAN